MHRSSKICSILWQNARIRGSTSNSQILQIPQWPQNITDLIIVLHIYSSWSSVILVPVKQKQPNNTNESNWF